MRRTYADIGLGRKSGVKCSNCGTTYSTCSNTLFRKGACCQECEETDTHDERDAMPTAKKAAPKPREKAKGLPLRDLQYITEGLESTEGTLTGFSRIVSATVVLDCEGREVTAEHDGTGWTVWMETD